MNHGPERKLVDRNERSGLEKYVNLTKDYSEDFVTLSAAHIEDAKYGRGHYGKAYAMESSISVRLAYNIRYNDLWHYFNILIITTHCILLFYINNKPHYITLEILCICCYIVDITVEIVFYSPSNFFTFSRSAIKSKLQALLTIFFMIDLVYTIYIYYQSDEGLLEHAIPFQCLRPSLFIIKIKTVYHIFLVVIKTFIRIFKTIFVIILYILFFSCIAVQIFGEIYDSIDDQDDETGRYKGQFSNCLLAFVRMFVLITTENYPAVMLPAYDYHNASFIYFMVFIYFGVFILMSILLAIVVDNYWTIAKANVKKERLQGRKELALAWNLLADGAEMLSVYDEHLLMAFRQLKPKNNDEEIIIFLQQLTLNKSIIEYKSWLTRVIDILDLEVEDDSEEEETNILSGLVKKSGGKCMIYLTLTIQSPVVQRVVLILLFIHTLLIAVFKTGEEELESAVQLLRLTISGLFVVEVMLRFGILAYLHWDEAGSRHRTFSERLVRWVKKASSKNISDVTLVILGTILNGLWFYIDESYTPAPGTKPSVYIAKGLCVVSSTVVFIIRLLVNSAEATKMFALLKLIIPVMLDLTGLFIICILVFATLGETIFTSSVRSQDLGSSSCKEYGFGTHWCSFVTLFQVSTTSNWHDLMQGIIDSRARYAGAVYFLLTYIFLHMVIINLFVAISYEAYNKFVSKPKANRRKVSAKSPRPSTLTGRLKWRAGRFGRYLHQYTTGNRKSVTSSPRPARRGSVTIKRKSLHGMREKISDSSLGEGGALDLGPRTIDVLPQTPDLSSLPREKRHEMILKQRMQQKGEAKGRARRQRVPREGGAGDKVGNFADVVRAYTAKGDDELSLEPGQKIKVLEKAGTKFKGLVIDGPNAGKHGWFPAFVVGSFVSELNKAAQNKKPLPKADSQPKFVKRQNADWTKDIIGPMTIMNPEELRELNKILKANSRGARSSTDSARGVDSPTKPPTTLERKGATRGPVQPAIIEEEEEEEDDNVFTEISKLYSVPMKLPEVVILEPSVILDEEEEEEQDKAHLQSPTIRTPEMKAKEKWKKKLENKTKDIPEWAKKFMSQSNAKVADASSIKTPSESETSDPLSKVAPPEPPKPHNFLKGLKFKMSSKDDLVIKNEEANKIKDVPGPKEEEHQQSTTHKEGVLKVKPRPVTRSESEPLQLNQKPPVKRSGTEVKITIQLPDSEAVEDFV